jgi:Na+/H+-translocating membrane pyrophosphatase
LFFFLFFFFFDVSINLFNKAIGSAVLTALSLLAAFKQKAGIQTVDVGDPIVLCGLLIGAMLPFLFAALTMLSVRKVSIE